MPGSPLSARCVALALALLVLAACAPAQAPTAVKPAAPAAPPPAAPAATAAPAAAQPATQPTPDTQAVANFYRGKTVRIVVAFPPGGGFDIVGRLVAKHIGKYIPGNPTVIVENMPGGASLVAANNVYNVAPKDGTVIGVVNGGATVVEQLFGAQGVQYDAARKQYIGAPGVFTYVLVMRKEAGINRFEELLGAGSREAVLGASNPGSTTYDAPILLRDTMGANMKVVSGYTGTAPILLAMERGEVDGLFNPWESLKPAINDQVRSGELLVLGQFAEKPHPDFPNVPEFTRLATNDEQRQLLRLGVIVPSQFAVQYFVAPGVPADRVQALEAAFAQTMKDPEYLADAERVNAEVEPLSGAQLRRLVEEFLAMPADTKTKLQRALRP